MFDASLWLHLGSLYKTRRIIDEAFSRTRETAQQGGPEHDICKQGVIDWLAKNWLYSVLI
jgi:hypothetical protein